MNAHVFLQMQILISLLPFQNLGAYLKFQKVDEERPQGDETSLEILEAKKPIIWCFGSSLCSASLEYDMFWRSSTFFLQVVLNVYKRHATCILHLWFTTYNTCDLPSSTRLALHLLLQIDTLFNSFSSALVNTMVRIVHYKCKSLLNWPLHVHNLIWIYNLK